MKKTFLLQLLLLSSSLLIVLPRITNFNFIDYIQKYDLPNAVETSNSKVTWLKFNELEEKLKASPKPILIDFYTNWCGWCKKMDATTFKDEQVVSSLDNSYYAIKINAESEEVIHFNGKEQPMYAIAREMGVSAFPTVVLLDTETQKSKKLVGFQKVKPILKQLSKFLD